MLLFFFLFFFVFLFLVKEFFWNTLPLILTLIHNPNEANPNPKANPCERW